MTDSLGRTDAGVTVRRRGDHAAMPWRNGRGTTYEVARYPEGEADFEWRISFAEVNEPGDFSAFPGVDRVITLVEGVAIALDVAPADGGSAYAHTLRPGEPFAFAGEDAIHAVPEGQTLDLNVMTVRGRFESQVTTLQCPTRVGPFEAVDATFVVCVEGEINVAAAGQEIRLGTLDVAEIHSPCDVTGPGTAQLVTLRRVD